MVYNNMDDYPEIKRVFEDMRIGRCDEILNHLREYDEEYRAIRNERVEQSGIIRNRLSGNYAEYERYMDCIYRQTIYELEAVYTHAFCDALSMLKAMNLIK